MGDVKADEICGGGEHLDGGFEQDDSDGAIHVVVAVEKDGLACGNGAFETLDGRGHAEHEEGIVEVRGLGIEESEGLSGRGDAARDEQLGQHERQARFAGQGSGFFRVRIRRGASAGAAGRELQPCGSGPRAALTGFTRPRLRASERRR